MNLPSVYASDAKPEPAPTPVVRRREWVHIIDGESVWLPYPPSARVETVGLQGEVALELCFVDPSQVDEFRERAKKEGIAVHYREDGTPVVPNTRRAMQAYYQHRGWFNKDEILSPRNR